MSIVYPISELSSVALGGRIVAVSDEFFAEAFHLLQVEVCLHFYVACNLIHFSQARAIYEGSVWTQWRTLQWLGNEAAQPNL